MDMDMDMDMSMSSSDSTAPLNSSGVDFSNATQAADFLGEILDDTVFQVDGNAAARHFWYGVCAVIGICAFFNLASMLTVKSRLRAAAANRLRPAAPQNLFTAFIAMVVAIAREASYPQITPLTGWKSKVFKLPPAGTIVLLVGYLAWVILLEFVNNDIAGAQHYTSLGVRAAWLAVGQVPLLILLAGKNNLIGLVTGVSYERLNVLHRWVSRVLLLLVIFHVVFLHVSWNAYDLGPLEYSTDSCIPTGWAVFAILIWMNISTIAPIRNFSYEIFVIQHILTFFGFIIAVMWHLPSTAYYSRVYIYIPVALYIIDRIIRSGRWTWNNSRPGRATLTALEDGVTKVCVRSKTIKSWTPGSFVLLSIPKFGWVQSHPATIASTPTSHGGDLVFLLKGHKGFTSRILKSASTSSISISSLPTTKEATATARPASFDTENHIALIDGPYGKTTDFASFDTLLLISGSTGITFTLPILLDIAHRIQSAKLPLVRITLIWVVKTISCSSWISTELTTAAEQLRAAGIELTIQIHATCDNAFTGDQTSEDKVDCDCACDKSIGPCCCISEVTSSTDKGTTISASSRPLACATLRSGRPDFYPLLNDLLVQAEGETAVVVCGPLGLSSTVRNTVARCSDERAVHKGTGAQGIFLHAECFGW